MNASELWNRYRSYLVTHEATGISVDISRMNFGDTLFQQLAGPMDAAFEAMDELEAGAIANPDEQRMVGHYWLRAPELAPTPEIRQAIDHSIHQVQTFAARVHDGRVAPPRGGKFRHFVLIGIGGSALGPQLVSDALGGVDDPMTAHFVDNTDPDGIDRVFQQLGKELERTVVVVISKSGGTQETKNGMIEADWYYTRAGLEFAKHAVAVTGAGSELFRTAARDGWIEIFPMWDWVGGRTSVLSVVGLLPAALQGLDILSFLEGAREMDRATRVHSFRHNPAALLAAMWHFAGDGKGRRDMVVLPYKDRLLLFSRYLQQLVMESLGKELDLQGRVVHQGVSVYGNKGSTDQHAYVQQLRDGLDNFFVTFLEVQRDRADGGPEVVPGVTSGDYLLGFLLGTRRALHDNNRESITITLPEVSARTLGALIALYDRAVGLYAQLVGINAYHQPGVEAGKKAAGAVVSLQQKLLKALGEGKGGTAEQLARLVGAPEEVETAFKVLEHLAANGRIRRAEGETPFTAYYSGAGRQA